MNNSQFDKLATKYFGDLLEPLGFSHEKSRYCTFYKQVSPEVYHLIVPELRRRGTVFIVMVFATSPLIQPDFEQLFPDDIGIPSDVHCYLDTNLGIGSEETVFRCNKKEGFIRNFTGEVAPAIMRYALPYLEKIQTLQELFPTIKVTKKADGLPNSEFYYGSALWQLHKKDEALIVLMRERNRLLAINDITGKVQQRIKFIDNLISPRLI